MFPFEEKTGGRCRFFYSVSCKQWWTKIHTKACLSQWCVAGKSVNYKLYSSWIYNPGHIIQFFSFDN
jgi:hypothetical protein